MKLCVHMYRETVWHLESKELQGKFLALRQGVYHAKSCYFSAERHVFVLDPLFRASHLLVMKAPMPFQLIYPLNMYLLVYTHK